MDDKPLVNFIITSYHMPLIPYTREENEMNTKAIIPALILCSSLFVAGNALARPDLTPEQLAKAREVAQQMKPPIDFDALLDEADRLGVKCTGNFTLRPIIKTCNNKVEIAQSKERQAELDEEYEAMGQEIKKTLDETRDIASEKLNQG